MAEGHRERLRERIEKENIDNIPDYVVLELMLTATIARRDTNALAHELIDKFGSLAGVVDAPEKELLKIPGMGKAAVGHLKFLPKFYKKYELSKWDDKTILQNSAAAGKYLIDKFIDCTVETVYVLCLDSNCRLIAAEKVYEGNINVVNISVSKIIACALKHNSARIIIGHNHPGGNALPSQEDKEMTNMLKNMLMIMGIVLDDHLVIANDDFVSIHEDDMKVKYMGD